MNDLPLHPIDELASAHLDGDTSPEERRRVDRDPAIARRVAELRAVREAVRVPDLPIDAERRERAVAAALAAATVGDLAAARARRAARGRRWQVAAAAVAAAAVAVLVVPRLGDDDPATTVTAEKAGDDAAGAASTLDASGPAADATTDGGVASTGDDRTLALESAPVAASAVRDLGTVADLGRLADAARAELAAPGAPLAAADGPDATSAGELDTCLAALQGAATGSGGSVVLAAIAVVDGQRVLALVAIEPDGATVLQVAALPGCATIDRRSL